MAANNNSLKEKFKSYHLNQYELQLSQSFSSKSILILDRRLQMLADKHTIDLKFTNRKNEFKSNLERYVDCLYQKYLNDKDKNEISFTQYRDILKQDLLQSSEAEKQLAYLNALKDKKVNSSSKEYKYEPYSVTNHVKNTISAINNPRLDHAVWSRSLVEIIIFSAQVSAPQLSLLLKAVALLNGFASYGFYVVRGGIDALVGAKNLLSKDIYKDNQIEFSDRFYFQVEQRYQRIINDLPLWAPVNYLTFHILVGNGPLGMAGNILTVALLVADFALAFYGYCHKVSQFKKIEQKIKSDIVATENKENKQALEEYLNEIRNVHLKDLEQLRYQLFYQAALVIAFSVLIVNTVPCMLTAGVTIFLLQLFLNEKDLYLQLKDETNAKERLVLLFKMFMKLFEHLMVPGIFVLVGLLVMPLLPALNIWLVLIATATITYNMLQLTHYITNLYSDYISGKLNQSQLISDIIQYVVMPAILATSVVIALNTLTTSIPIAMILGVSLFFLSNNLMQWSQKCYDYYHKSIDNKDEIQKGLSS